jgi:hypothetical protein
VVIGWAAAQAPRFLPGMTVTQAAAGRSTLIALLIAVAVGLIVLIPSLILLYTLFLRGKLAEPDTAELPAEDPVSEPVKHRSTKTGGLAVATLVAGAVLVVFAGSVWLQVLGVACLVVCAVSAFGVAVE